MSRLRIVVDLQCCQNGSRLRGIGRYAMAMTRALLAAGSRHEIWVALSDRFPGTIAPVRRQLAGLIAPERIVVFSLPAHVAGADEAAAWRSRAAEALREHVIASLRPDVVFLPSLFEGFWDDCVTSIGRQPVPTAVAIHDLIPLVWPADFVSAPHERACYNRKLLSLKRADLWLAVSDYSRQEAIELLDLPQDRILSTSEAADERFRPAGFDPLAEAAVRDRFGLPLPFVMFTSAIEPRKNVDGLIRAYGALPADVRDGHRLVLVGGTDDPMREHLAAAAAQAGLAPGEMVLTGHVTDEDLIALYSLCKTFVFPSFHEGFGLPALEAMACGAPVIGSGVSSIPEVIGREDALFDPADTGAMSALLLRVLTDAPYRAALRSHAPRRASAFSWERSARRALAGFEAVHAERAAWPRRAPTQVRPRLAYVTALPPRADISARRASSLLPELARHYEIDIVCDQELVDAPWLTANFAVRSVAWLAARADDVDRIVYDVEAPGPGLRALVVRHPGVVVLDTLFPSHTRPELSDAAFLHWLYEGHGYDAAATAVERGRAAAADAYPMVQDLVAGAAGVIVAADGLRDCARGWLGPIAVEPWRRLSHEGASPRNAADAMAEAIEAFALEGPAARGDRLFADFAKDCPAAPTDDDLVATARCLAANARPAGRNRLFLDVGPIAAGRLFVRDRCAALRQIAQLITQGRFGRRVEPVYAEGDGFRYARAIACEALGLPDLGVGDEPVCAFAGDVYLALSPPSELGALAGLHERGVTSLCLVTDETRLLSPGVLPAFLPILRAWIDHACADGSGRRIWTSGAALTAARTCGETSGTALAAIRRLWSEGADVAALVVGPPGTATSCAGPDAQDAASPFDSPAWSDLDAALLDAGRPCGSDAETSKPLQFAVRGHVLGSYSLAQVNRTLARVLDRAHPGRVRLDPLENGEVRSLAGVPACERAQAQALAARRLSPAGRTVVISQHYPVLAPTDGDHDLSIALTAWEESLTPKAFADDLSRGFDAVLATSAFTARALIDSGLRTPVISIGQPPDLSAFAALATRPRPPPDPFTFLHVSSGMPRKGVDVLLAAWGRAFGRSDPVRLVIKTFPNPNNDIAERLADFARRYPDAAEIRSIDEDLPPTELIALYARANAVVSPSRGEGYNLPALEAMAAGIPLVVTGCSGHRDFCGPAEARLLLYRLARSSSHVSAPHGLWAEPDEDDLVAALREMADPAQARAIAARADRAQRVARAAASPARWVERLEDVVACRLAARPAPPPLPRIAWVTTWNIRCGIAEYSRILLESFTAETREAVTILADARTPSQPSASPPTVAAWTVGVPGAWEPIAQAIESQGPDVVVIQHQDGLLPWPELSVLLADSRLSGRVSVVVLHNAVQLATQTEGERAQVARALRRASRVLVHTLADVNLLLRMGVAENVALLPHGAARGPATPRVRDLPASAAPIVGCHGFFLPGKGIDRLIEACARLRRTWPGLTLRLVNARFPAGVSDEEIDRCRRLAGDLGLGDAIDWRTEFMPQDEIVKRLADCDLIVLAYDERTDSASGAVRVALSSLAPVAVTRVGIFQELEDAVGWLPSNDPQAMAPAIADLLLDQDRRRAIQARATAWLQAHDWALVAARLEGMIHGLVAADRLERAMGSAGLLAAVEP